jgi:hypothetical protein
LLTISWTGKMQLNARTTDAKRRPTCRAEFQGRVMAQMDDASIQCDERLIIHTTQPVPLEQIELVSKRPVSDNLNRRPQTMIAAIRAYRNVVLLGRIDDSDKHLVVRKQRFEATAMLGYDGLTGSYHIPGKGRLLLYGRAPANPATDKGPLPALIRTDITFNKEMTAQLAEASDADTLAQNQIGTSPNWFRASKIKSLSLLESPQSLNTKSPNPRSLQIKATGDVSIVCGDSSLESKEGYFDLASE